MKKIVLALALMSSFGLVASGGGGGGSDKDTRSKFERYIQAGKETLCFKKGNLSAIGAWTASALVVNAIVGKCAGNPLFINQTTKNGVRRVGALGLVLRVGRNPNKPWFAYTPTGANLYARTLGRKVVVNTPVVGAEAPAGVLAVAIAAAGYAGYLAFKA